MGAYPSRGGAFVMAPEQWEAMTLQAAREGLQMTTEQSVWLAAEVTRLRAVVTEAALETYTPDGSERFVAQFHRVLAERNALRAGR